MFQVQNIHYSYSISRSIGPFISLISKLQESEDFNLIRLKMV